VVTELLTGVVITVGTPDPARARGAEADGGGPRQHDDRQDPVVTERAVSKHIGNVFLKLSRRERQRAPPVLAVLAYLQTCDARAAVAPGDDTPGSAYCACTEP